MTTIRPVAGHLAGLCVALVIVAWGTGVIVLPDPGATLDHAMQAQIDYEDGTLCQKFGFAPGTPAYVGCKLDLADLRRRDEQLQATFEFP